MFGPITLEGCDFPLLLKVRDTGESCKFTRKADNCSSWHFASWCFSFQYEFKWHQERRRPCREDGVPIPRFPFTYSVAERQGNSRGSSLRHPRHSPVGIGLVSGAPLPDRKGLRTEHSILGLSTLSGNGLRSDGDACWNICAALGKFGNRSKREAENCARRLR
jgi:hypothetical protein